MNRQWKVALAAFVLVAGMLVGGIFILNGLRASLQGSRDSVATYVEQRYPVRILDREALPIKAGVTVRGVRVVSAGVNKECSVTLVSRAPLKVTLAC